ISAPRCFLPATPTPQISTLSLHDALPISYQVNAQADMRFRLSPDDILRLKVRNAEGEMVPLGAFVTLDETAGPDRVMHYNGYVTADINVGPAPGFSSGEPEALITDIVNRTLRIGVGFERPELTHQLVLAGNPAVWVFPLVVLLAFLVLAALYGSLALPFVVRRIVPLCLLSAITGVW